MKILSLDIGSSTIKAVELEVTFGRIELADYRIETVVESQLVDVKADDEKTKGAIDAVAPRRALSDGQLEAITRLLKTKSGIIDKLVVNLPKGWSTSRIFRFPTKDRKAIQNSLGFELEDDIPFAIENVAHDFAILNFDGTNSNVYSTVALKSDVQSVISELNTIPLDPDMITVDSWGISNLLKRAIPKEYEGRPICIVNIGAKQTAIHMFVGSDPILTHTSTCAGNDITKAIAQTYNLGFDQAEKSKVEGAFLITEAHNSKTPEQQISQEQRAFSETIATALAPLIREIKQTMMSYKSQHKLLPRAIFITGGSSLISNIGVYLEEQLQIPVFQLSYISRIVGQTLQLSDASEANISTAMGLGLSIIKPERNSSINFRKDDFSKSSTLGSFSFQTYKRPLQYMAASLVFIYVNLIAQSLILSQRFSKQDEQLERSIKSVVGAVSSSVLNNYKASPSSLRNAVSKEIAKYKENQTVTPKAQISAFDILSKVSASMPKDFDLDVSIFEIKEGHFKLAGTLDQASATPRIIKTLEDSHLFTNVVKNRADEDPKTKKVTFEIGAKIAAKDTAVPTGPTGGSNVKNR